MSDNIRIGDEFWVAEKTSDVYRDVTFIYKSEIWQGILPKVLRKQGLDLTEEEWVNLLEQSYTKLNPENRQKWIKERDSEWSDKQKLTETYKVLRALYSANWTCRVHGPLKTNSQPAARISALKKLGYIIGAKRKQCPVCGKSTMHDILIMLDKVETRFSHGNELRMPLSDKLKHRIKEHFKFIDSCFDMQRAPVELVIDHKFPSQRWINTESENPNDMKGEEMENKFQLLTNQTNMLKSRYCDRCVKTGERGDFFGIKWYSQGGEKWNGKTKDDETGCFGCPWYDLNKWKVELEKTANK